MLNIEIVVELLMFIYFLLFCFGKTKLTNWQDKNYDIRRHQNTLSIKWTSHKYTFWVENSINIHDLLLSFPTYQTIRQLTFLNHFGICLLCMQLCIFGLKKMVSIINFHFSVQTFASWRPVGDFEPWLHFVEFTKPWKMWV